MKDRGDAVADRLPVTVHKRDIERKIDARARHHLPFEGVAMQIDDARQHQEVARVKLERTAPPVGTDRTDFAICDRQLGAQNLFAEQRPTAFNEKFGHDRALRRGAVARDAASYFSRNSSISSVLKSGRAAWSVS